MVGTTKVWLSEPRSGGWLQVQLQGNGLNSNRDALGATVWVEKDGESRIYAYGAGGETSSTSEHALNLGLGDWENVNLRVRFPSGTEVLREDVSKNQSILIEEPI